MSRVPVLITVSMPTEDSVGYRGDDPDYAPQVIPAGSGFVDDGDVHLVRNEGTIEAVVYVTSIVPGGAMRRIDEPNPGNCPF